MMIKNIIIGYGIILSMLVLACNNASIVDNKPNLSIDSKPVQVQLIDSLGTISLSIPLRYDTSFSWIYHSDCGKPCNEQKYRFQPKILQIYKESGMLRQGELKDSIDQLTISHSGYFPFHDGDTAIVTMSHKQLKKQLIFDQTNPPLIFDTVEKINDRYFSIFIMEKYDTLNKQYSKKVFAATTIKSNLININYELLTKRKDSTTSNFVQNSIDEIKTIHISKGI